ncbi:hypothetical protein ABGV40_27265 [Paenibacillus amylolyticus]|uniref:hypothetical protein n=1 Tax=Paenibacillus amylolyticus TaxID=1451 RepID=UPI0032420496
MRKKYDFQNIIHKKDNLSVLLEMLNEGDFWKFNSLARAEGLFTKNTDENKKIINEASHYISTELKSEIKEEWEKTIYTAEVLNELMNNFFNSIDFQETKKIEKSDELSLILITSELLSSYSFDKDLQILKEPYIELESVLKSIINMNNSNGTSNIQESMSRRISTLIKYVYFDNKNKEINFSKEYSINELNISSKNHISIERYQLIMDLFEQFKFSQLSATESEDGTIQFRNSDKNFFDSYAIYKYRNQAISSQHKIELQNYEGRFKKLVDDRTKLFPPTKGRTLNELFSFIGLVERLYEDDLNLLGKVEFPNKLEVNVLELLRAYTILVQLAEEFIHNRGDVRSCSIDKVCLVLTYEKIIDAFEKGGIEKKNSCKIIEILTFNRKSDLSESPLLKFNDKYIIVPSICVNTPVHLAIMSRINQFKDQGKAFEKKIISALSKAGVKASSKKMKFNEDWYDCDLMFAIKNELYLCECKAWGDANSLRGYYEQYIKKQEAVEQLNRIADYYSTNIKIVIKELSLKQDWKPTRVHRVIFTNVMVGDIEKIDEVIIMDYSSLAKFIKRDKPELRISNGKKIVLKGFSMFDSKITLKRMNEFLYSDVSLRLQKARIQKKNEFIELFDKKILIESYYEKFPNYFIVDDSDDKAKNDYIKAIQSLNLK